MIRKIASLVLVAAMMVACSKNNVTGRHQLKLLPESDLQAMALTQYQHFLTSNKVIPAGSNRDAELVQRVGQRVTRAVSAYYSQKGLKGLEGYNWEYHLVDNKEANAWCMPGGKIVVYTGLLPYTQNETALAIVMGHEISHAIFNHGNERMSQGMLQQLGSVALSVAVINKPAETQNLFLAAYGAGTTVGGLLPFSRKHELEADHYGLFWAVMAGYNPEEAIPFWQRMEKGGGQKPPEFLSTHPSEGSRVDQLKKYMPEALTYYKAAGK